MQKTLSKDWFEAFNARDWTSMAQFYAEDVLFHAKNGDKVGPTHIIETAKKWVTRLPDLQIHPVHTRIEQQHVVVVHWRAQACSNELVFHGLTCFRCENGAVIEHWASVDYRPIAHLEKLANS